MPFGRETPARTLAWILGAEDPHAEFQRLTEPLQLTLLGASAPCHAASFLQVAFAFIKTYVPCGLRNCHEGFELLCLNFASYQGHKQTPGMLSQAEILLLPSP